MALTFTASWPWLLLALLPVFWWLAANSRRGLSRRRRFLVASLRTASVLCVVAALTGPGLPARTDALSVVYALDVSHSVAPESVRDALAWMRESIQRYRPAHARFVVFADRAELRAQVDELDSVPVGTSGAPGALDQRATDLERALGAALVGFHPGYARRLVLISDGKQTQGDVWRQLPRLKDSGVRVFTLPAPTRFAADASIESIDVPAGVRASAPVPAVVRLQATAALRARLELRIGREARLQRTIALRPGRNDVPVDLRFPRPGDNTVSVTVVTPDGRSDSADASIWVGPRVRLLHVEGGHAGARYLPDTLTAHGIDVRSVSPAQLSEAPAMLLRWADAVALSDVNAGTLTDAASRELETFVRDGGGGLVFVAGENTYGKDGFSDSPLEAMLPVTFEARRKRNELDLVLLLDRSYSMTGDRIELAKTAALATLDLMESQHRLAVVAFDSKPHDVVPLAKVGSKRRAEDGIGGIATGGRTDVYSALVRAQELLKDSESRTKHVILLTDGQSVPPPNARTSVRRETSTGPRATLVEQLRGMGYSAEHIRKLLNEDGPERPADANGGYEELVGEMASAGITLSTVAIGEAPNLALLATIAAHGSGKAYVAQRDSEIPGLFVSEARRLLGEALVEERFRPVIVGEGEVLTGIDFKAGPELQGYVATKPRRFSDVLLEAGNNAPLLAETRFGLGKTVAFLSDAKNRWAKDWLSWPGYGRFWSQVVRDAARPLDHGGLAWTVARQENSATIELTALNPDGRFRNELWPKVRVTAPDGTPSVVVLRQSAPGTYTATVQLAGSESAPTRFELLPGPGLTSEEIGHTGARTLRYANRDEFRPRAPDLALLRALSERTGGKFAPAPEEIFAPPTEGGVVTVALWPFLAALALAIALVEIAARRLPWRVLDGP